MQRLPSSARVQLLKEISSRSSVFARAYVQSFQEVLQDFPFDAIGHVLALLEEAQCSQCMVFLAGNGGSAATASHMASDLAKTVGHSGKSELRAQALTTNTELLTAIANDEGYEQIFAHQLRVLGNPGDIFLAFSVSGDSVNLIEAVHAARAQGLRTVGFLGDENGKLTELVDIAVRIPSSDYGVVEDAHLMCNHLITAYLRHGA